MAPISIKPDAAPVEVPTLEEFRDLQEEVRGIPTDPPPAPAPSPITVVEHPDTILVADNTEAALRAAINTALSTKVGGVARKRILLRAGAYNITQPDLIGSPVNGQADPIFGLELHGMGSRVTQLNFNPAGAVATTDPRRNNLFTLANRVRNFKLKDMKFTSQNPAANMLWAWSVASVGAASIYPEYGAGQNQRFKFEDVEWGGAWNRVFGVDGDSLTNNNSEWTWQHCATDNSARYADAFMHLGGISGVFPQQTQYLNFRLDDCNMTFLGGTFWKQQKGGNVYVTGGSWSAANNQNAMTWFDFDGSVDPTAGNLRVENVRFEPKAANQRIIRNTWGAGHVTFVNCSDVASLQYPMGSTQGSYALHEYVARNGRFPIIRYQDCTLVGVHKFSGGQGGNGKAIYEGNRLYHWNRPVASAAGAGDGFLQYAGTAPRYAFRDTDMGLADVAG